MKVWFIQGFTKEIQVFYDINNGALKSFTVADDIVIEELDKKLETDFFLNEPISEVYLKGHTKALKDMEDYYKQKEGVTIQWL